MKKSAILIGLLLVILMSGCYSANEQLSKSMNEKYSNDQNYVALFGEVVEFSDNFVAIKCEEISNYISYEDEICDYYIYTNQSIELSIGDQIEFVTVPFHFYNGHRLPIVELKKDGSTLLQFGEGKQNLLDWVNAKNKELF